MFKGMKQLLANHQDVLENLSEVIGKFNSMWKDFITTQVLAKTGYYIGFANYDPSKEHEIIVKVYRLTIKSNPGNFRQSSIQGVIKCVGAKDSKLIVYGWRVQLSFVVKSLMIQIKFKNISNAIYC